MLDCDRPGRFDELFDNLKPVEKWEYVVVWVGWEKELARTIKGNRWVVTATPGLSIRRSSPEV